MATLARLAEVDAPEVPAYVTEDEYVRMRDAGVFEPFHVELAGGVLERVAPSGPGHALAFNRVGLKLGLAYEGGAWGVFADGSVRIAPSVMRAPDLTVARLPVSGDAIPAEAVLLAVEIADASRHYDLTRKAADYTLAGIPHYWVVDVVARETHVMGAPVDGAYTQVGQVAFGDPLALPDSERTITLAD